MPSPSVRPLLACSAFLAATASASVAEGPDGVWHFLNDPVAQHRDGLTFLAFVDSTGAPGVAAYDHVAQCWTRNALRPPWKVDDHASPTLLIRERDQRLLAFYARGSDLYFHVSERPLDASSFGPATALTARDGNFPRPVQITEHGESVIFLFYRDRLASNQKRPALRLSRDGGDSWSPPRPLIDFGDWMYPKAILGPDGSIHLLITSNPHHMGVNNLYYVRYRDGAFFHADGSQSLTLDKLPLTENHLDLVLASPGPSNTAAFRASDLAFDASGHPAIVGVRYDGPDRRSHTYLRLWFDGNAWRHETIATTAPLSNDTEMGWVYFGGISFDRPRSDHLHYSALHQGVFELFSARRQPDGVWTHTPLTRLSTSHQIRPWPVDGLPGAIISLEGTLERYNAYQTRIKLTTP